MSSSMLHYGQMFVKSWTFIVWQWYCRKRDGLMRQFGVGGGYEIYKPTINNIRRYILTSSTFQLWLKLYLIKITVYDIVKKYTPRIVKNYLKFGYEILLSIIGVSVSPDILREWNAYASTRTDTAIDFLNLSIISYNYRFQRPQQLAKNLALNGHRVFYIECEFHYAPTPKVAWVNAKKVGKNVYVIKLSASHNFFIYRDTLTKKGQKIILASLKKLMRQCRVVNPVLKIDHPFWYTVAEVLHMPIIYDAMDYHQGFKETGRAIAELEKELVKKADLVLASSDFLYRAYKPTAKRIISIKNAADYEHFHTALTNLRTPSDLVGFHSRIIGYYGAIADWLDESIIERLVQDFPHDHIVLIGRLQNKSIISLASRHPNLHLLGEKSYSSLPSYLKQFDVCLIPFKLTPLIQATNPVKIYEYFSSGKPVVATKIPELELYRNLIYQASTPVTFSRAVKQALAEHSPAKRKARLKVAQAETWETRTRKLVKELNLLVFPKVSVIILTYNNAKLSKTSIDSVIERSKYGNLEIIIVDNNSNAETVKMLGQYRTNKIIKLKFNQVNHGFAKGNNIGMKLATGDYIVLLNNDVRVTPGWIERLLFRARSGEVGLVGPVTNSIGNESKIKISYDPENTKELESRAADYVYTHWGESLELSRIAAFAWLMPKRVYQKLGGLDERYGRGLFEDDDYCMRVQKAGLKIVVTEDSFVHHYGGASTNWGSSEYQKLFQINQKKFETKWKIKWLPHKYREGVR